MAEEKKPGEPDYVICVAWAERIVPSVRVYCFECGADLAMMAQNVDRARECHAEPVCAACALPHVAAGAALNDAFVNGRWIPEADRDALLRYLREAAEKRKPPS